jgi:hypothetical protein
VNLTSSVQYFVCTMPLLSIDWVRLPYLKGIATSAGVGSESVLCASRAAIVAYVRYSSKQQRISLWDDCFALIRFSLEDERLSVPSLELVGFLLENGAWDGIEPTKRGCVPSPEILISKLIVLGGTGFPSRSKKHITRPETCIKFVLRLIYTEACALSSL